MSGSAATIGIPGVTEEGLAALLERHGLGALQSVSRLEGGTVNAMLLLNGQLVLRLNQRDPHLPKLSWEQLIYQRLRRSTDVPCPEVLALDLQRDLVPFDALVLSYVEGVTGASIWSSLDRPTQEQLSEALGRMCGTIHGLHWPVYGEFVSVAATPLQSIRWTDIINRKIRDTYERALPLDLLPPPLLDGLITMLNDGDAVFNTAARPTLTHTDLWLSNVLLRQGRAGWEIAAIIDWEWAIIADSAWEFADLWADPFDPYPLRESFMHGYRERHALPLDLRVRQQLYRLLYSFEAMVNSAQRAGSESAGVRHYRAQIERLLAPTRRS